MNWRVICGDVRERLRDLAAGSMQTCVTSPPYWGLRDYGDVNQLGLEPTPDAYVENMVDVFRLVRHALADDGTVWLNIGDSYAGSGKGPSNNSSLDRPYRGMSNITAAPNRWLSIPAGIKSKDLVGIPWRVAFALQADGWYLRSDIIWSKPNPMPESVTDRPTKAHEYLFLLSKSSRYYYDAASIREPLAPSTLPRYDRAQTGYAPPGQTAHRGVAGPREHRERGHRRPHAGFNDNWDAMSKDEQQQNGANKRSVWTVATTPYPEAHFATYPPALIEPCILAGSRTGDTVLDPFTGSGTTGEVAIRHSRSFAGIELNPEYVKLARARIGAVAPLLAEEIA